MLQRKSVTQDEQNMQGQTYVHRNNKIYIYILK